MQLEISSAVQTERRRQQCRQNQAKYRQKQNQYELDLNEAVIELRRQVASLERQREVILRGISSNLTVWGVAVEYFRLFRRGYKAPVLLRGFTSPTEPHDLNVQLDFLRSTMTSDVTDSNVYGVGALLEQWRLYSLYHGDVQMELERVERGPHDSVIATTTTSVTITEDTLLHVFPHLLDGHQRTGRYLASRLLGWRFSMRGSVRFHWDDATGRVKRLTCESDMLTPMMKLLGDLEDVALVFNGALLTLDNNLVAAR